MELRSIVFVDESSCRVDVRSSLYVSVLNPKNCRTNFKVGCKRRSGPEPNEVRRGRLSAVACALHNAGRHDRVLRQRSRVRKIVASLRTGRPSICRGRGSFQRVLRLRSRVRNSAHLADKAEVAIFRGRGSYLCQPGPHPFDPKQICHGHGHLVHLQGGEEGGGARLHGGQGRARGNRAGGHPVQGWPRISWRRCTGERRGHRSINRVLSAHHRFPIDLQFPADRGVDSRWGVYGTPKNSGRSRRVDLVACVYAPPPRLPAAESGSRQADPRP